MHSSSKLHRPTTRRRGDVRNVTLGLASLLLLVITVTCKGRERVTIVEVSPEVPKSSFVTADPDIPLFYDVVGEYAESNGFEFVLSTLHRPGNLEPCRRRELYEHADGRAISIECWELSLRAFVYQRTIDSIGMLHRRGELDLISGLAERLEREYPGRVRHRLRGLGERS